jgi:hypothetical protein
MPCEFHRWDGEEPRFFSNVTGYYGQETEDRYGWQITYDSWLDEPTPGKSLYFILDSMNHNAFCHWVYENATWIPLFQRIRQRYPSCKLVLEERKQYKDLFLDFYTIPSDCVCLKKDIDPENSCFFHAYTSLNDPSIPSIYFNHIIEFQERIYGLSVDKTIPILYLPRGTKENLQGPNNRTYNIQDELKDYVRSIGGTVYETDITLHLEDQIRLVKSAKILLLDYGSNLWVNGLFAHESQILCLNIGWQHHSQFLSLHYIWNQIHQTNTVTQVYAYPSEQTAETPISVVCFHLPEILHTLQHLLDISRTPL